MDEIRPLVFRFVAHPHPGIRTLVAHATATLCDKITHPAMEAVVVHLLPFLSDPEHVESRLGATEALHRTSYKSFMIIFRRNENSNILNRYHWTARDPSTPLHSLFDRPHLGSNEWSEPTCEESDHTLLCYASAIDAFRSIFPIYIRFFFSLALPLTFLSYYRLVSQILRGYRMSWLNRNKKNGISSNSFSMAPSWILTLCPSASMQIFANISRMASIGWLSWTNTSYMASCAMIWD